jgi:hypothetical protein
MKKVRMLGFVGAGPLVLSLAVPATNAAADVTHHQKSGGKTVSLEHVKRPLVDCSTGTNHSKSEAKASHDVRLSGGIDWTGTLCVRTQWMKLQSRKTGLTERIRYYSGGGRMEHSYFIGGTLIGSTTSFLSNPNVYAHQVCNALVANSNHNDVKYGPLCFTT